MTNTFHPWEGEEGKISTQYKIVLIQMAKEDIVKERYEKAIECLKKADHGSSEVAESRKIMKNIVS